MRLLFVFKHEFKFSHSASQTAADINRAFDEGFTCDRTVRCWFQKFPGGGEYEP